MNIEHLITSTLSQVTEPLLGLTLTQLNLKPHIEITDNELHLSLEAGFPTQFIEAAVISRLTHALNQILPKYDIKVTLDFFIQAHRTQLVGKGLRGVKNTIAIASGKGGVGKSTVAVNLAIALARSGARVGILDADIYGPSIPLMLGQTAAVTFKDEHYLPVNAHGIQAMSIGYLTDANQALIWRGPMLAKSLIQMLDLTQWDSLDYLLIDLPPGTGDIQLSLVQKIPLTGAIVVTTPQAIATLDAQKAITMFERTHINVLGLVENMALHHCSQCGHQEDIFGTGGAENLSKTFSLPLLGQLPLDSRIRSQSDLGSPIALEDNELATPFLRTALEATIQLSTQPLNYTDKFQVTTSD